MTFSQREGNMMLACWLTRDSYHNWKGWLSVVQANQCVCTVTERTLFACMYRHHSVEGTSHLRCRFSMSTIRVTVEWLFGEVTNSFKALDFKRNLKLELSSVGKMYVAVCTLLGNALTCLYGNHASEFFWAGGVLSVICKIF